MPVCEQFLHISFQEHSSNYLVFSFCHVESKYETDMNKIVAGLWIFPIREKKKYFGKKILHLLIKKNQTNKEWKFSCDCNYYCCGLRKKIHFL